MAVFLSSVVACGWAVEQRFLGGAAAGGAAGGGGGGPCMQAFVSCTPQRCLSNFARKEKLAMMQVQELKGLRMQHQPRTLNF